MRFADQIADSTGFAARGEHALAEVEHGVGDAALTHLVVQPGQHHVVALTHRPVGADQVLGHDEQ